MRATVVVTRLEHNAPVGRRADPERIFQARRAAVRYSLMDYGMDEPTANRWCDAWELKASGRGYSKDATYWQAGHEWFAAERAARRLGL